MLSGRRILVGVTGGIAAYKVCEVVSTLAQAGAQVRVVLTDAAQRFVSALSFATLARARAYTDADFWSAEHSSPLHIELGQWAEAILLAPLSANTLARLSLGLADNLLTNVVLASEAPILLAPAMNTQMWEQPVVAGHWQQLSGLPRYHTSGPGCGRLACDAVGAGRMSEPSVIVDHLASLLWTGGRRDLAGKTVLVTGGGTREFLDPVRFIGNPSTGRMGIALATACAHRGALVHLVLGPSELPVPPEVQLWPVTSARQMEQRAVELFAGAHLIFMAAAVADVRPRTKSPDKIPKASLGTQLELVAVDDILLHLAHSKQDWQTLVGFAAQTGEDWLTAARHKLERKHLDWLVANRVDEPGQGFGSRDNQAMLLSNCGHSDAIPLVSKLEMAHRLLDRLEKPS
ncbi:bifunctional phosphopantothenoylcysteine decarboxylase/phosphopantothenate--cysteine ligase CoaBC [Gloeobacter kilaueensis]|uniref:Coenzyme A biosynthesis bifunctional protein CoaBC n=1 Tax=Gloeobacter kilaueensis (strain ATCC BAA-2537 / CCAP 1431/1 / ULC 316 / JS1) TaxID=1183438 RepID=U5QDR2_GLOK1|nr:bifunctional phosphopantothenoylcysteine decarboxylase/phosphopantothenate--cysteine ligase CoaBC [Gloeobacter kilaueensis]AGY57087.1 bifunctional phosphopantothenoylcysteine decarboxylase/phosphopantothenate synthase [Gloeobacter kilaueensis JS1]